MLAVGKKDLKLRMNNLQLLMRKSAVCFNYNFQKESNSRNHIYTTSSYLWLFKYGKP